MRAVKENREGSPTHPLLRGTNTRFDVPHSRWHEVTSAHVRYAAGELDALLPTPEHYYSPEAARRVHDHVETVVRAREAGGGAVDGGAPAFPEADLAQMVDTTWTDTGRALFNNWLGPIYRLTDVTRGVPFMPGVDPEDPLGAAAGR